MTSDRLEKRENVICVICNRRIFWCDETGTIISIRNSVRKDVVWNAHDFCIDRIIDSYKERGQKKKFIDGHMLL